jgi:hypothetical protein
LASIHDGCRAGTSILTTVHAYLDDGPMMKVSRWRPRRVLCTRYVDRRDIPGTPHVVKYRQGKTGTCALVSEMICFNLLRAGGLRVLDACLVAVSEGFAASYRGQSGIGYSVEGGLHFGTALRRDVENGPPNEITDLEDLQELLDIWVFDSWLCNTDREVYGNILMELGLANRFRLIAADQSDCFGGAKNLSDGRWKKILEDRGAASSVSFLDTAIYREGVEALRKSVQKVHLAAASLHSALSAVPGDWWTRSGIHPEELRDALEHRARKIAKIIDIPKWENLDSQISGAFILKIDLPKQKGPKR